ncbi:MAG: hypothetical protein AB1831_09775 [Pseudomonadota bacterium]
MKKRFKNIQEWRASIPNNTWALMPSYLITPALRKEFDTRDPLEQISELRNTPTASDRDIVMECVGLLDKLVSNLLIKFSVEDIGDQLFGPNGKVRDLETRQHLALAFGLITKEEHSIQTILRQIRNKFAHDAALRRFDHDQKVISHIQSLPLPKNNPMEWPMESLRDRILIVSLYQLIRMLGRQKHACCQTRVALDLSTPMQD